MLGKLEKVPAASTVRPRWTTWNKSQEGLEKGKEKAKKAVLTFRRFLLNNDILKKNFGIDNLLRFQKMCLSLYIWFWKTPDHVCSDLAALHDPNFPNREEHFQLREQSLCALWAGIFAGPGVLPSYPHKQNPFVWMLPKTQIQNLTGFPTICCAPIRRYNH